MKVAIIGGTGVFGSRIAEMLARDGHEVLVCGRRLEAATEIAQAIGATALALDRTKDLPVLWEQALDVVVDAAGTFQMYGKDPYQLPRQAIEQGVHFFDLSDDAAFSSGINELDQLAKENGVFVLSGVSSVPALSASVVSALAKQLDTIVSIETAILPGNRAPRGQSVVDSILLQTGLPFRSWLAGRWIDRRNWSKPMNYDLGHGIKRRGYLINVPDLLLFPKAFGAKSVIFRAGLELPVMNYGLAILSVMRSKLGFGFPGWFRRLVRWAADVLHPFGSNVGGMIVMVTGLKDGVQTRAVWRLLAREGDGPYIPGIAVRALLRRPEAIEAGARTPTSDLDLETAEAAMSDLAVESSITLEYPRPIFPSVLGHAFQDLNDAVQLTHSSVSPTRWEGRGKVTRGSSLFARVLAWLFRFPDQADDVEVRVTKTPTEDTETWARTFGQRRFQSVLTKTDAGMTERFWPFTFLLELKVQDGALSYPVKAGRMGPIPLPKWLLPTSKAREFEQDGVFHFDVELRAPITGALLVHYQGQLTEGR